MPADYDLLVIGNTVPGCYAAWWASRYFARVALVTQTDPSLQAAELEGAAAKLLTTQGVDVIEGKGAFQPSREGQKRRSPGHRGQCLCFATAQRTLTTRHALIAVAAQPIIPDILGLETIPYLFPADLALNVPQAVPVQRFAGQRIGILGADPDGLEAAIQLRQQGAAVVLWTEQASLLPVEDTELVHCLQAQYAAWGIEYFTATRIQRIQPDAQRLRVEAVSLADSGAAPVGVDFVDQIVLASPRQADFSTFNVGSLGLDPLAQIPVSPALQTSNPRVWICGDSLGGYASPQIGVYEAKLAVENALFNRQRPADYGSVPWQLLSGVPLTRVGLNEAQAQRRYPNQHQVIRFSWPCIQPISGAEAATWDWELTAFCKLIVDHQGLLLGAHLICPQSADVIVPLTQAIQHQIPLVAIANMTTVCSSEFEQVRQGIVAWLMHQQTQDLPQRDRWEQFFWRSRSRGR